MEHRAVFDLGGTASKYDPEGGPYIKGVGAAPFPTMTLEKYEDNIFMKFSAPVQLVPWNRAAALKIINDMRELLGLGLDPELVGERGMFQTTVVSQEKPGEVKDSERHKKTVAEV